MQYAPTVRKPASQPRLAFRYYFDATLSFLGLVLTHHKSMPNFIGATLTDHCFMLSFNKAMMTCLDTTLSFLGLALTHRKAMPNFIGATLTCITATLTIIGLAANFRGSTVIVYGSMFLSRFRTSINIGL